MQSKKFLHSEEMISYYVHRYACDPTVYRNVWYNGT